MICNDCGANISSDSIYCKQCGAKVGSSVRTTKLTAEDLEPVAGKINQERLTKLLEMAFWHFDVGNRHASQKACEAALSINPSSTTAHALLATIHEKNGEFAEAVKQLEAVLAINPDSDADKAKLEQLRKGDHAQIIQPPTGYRWIPPALTAFSGTGLRLRMNALGDVKVGNVRMVPVVCALAVVGIVLAAGMMALRAPARAVVAAAPPVPMVLPTPAPLTNPLGLTSPPSTSELTPPSPAATTQAAPTGNTGAKSASHEKLVPLSEVPDVFANPNRPAVNDDDSAGEFHVPPRPSYVGSEAGMHALPALQAVPLDGGGTGNTIPPAPVSVGTPLVSTDNIPRHTVIVSNLGGQPADGQTAPAGQTPAVTATVAPQDASTDSTQAGVASQQSAPQTGDSDAGEQTPVIHITVHDAPPASQAQSTDIDRGTAPVTMAPVHVDEGQAYQQYALSLQEQGDYRGAMAAYQRAIHTYNAEIRAGQNTADAKRGLQACQTGLEICQQSLP